jgi:hypothetical protein
LCLRVRGPGGGCVGLSGGACGMEIIGGGVGEAGSDCKV